MASPKTLAQMRAMVRELADQESLGPTTAFADTTELDDRINEHLARLYDLLIEVRGQEYYCATWSITSIADQSEYPLPARFYQLLGVRASDGNSERNLSPWGYQMLASLRNSATSGASSLYRFFYRLQGANISIQPAPASTSFTFHIDYVPRFDGLEAPGDTFDGVNGWEKWAAYGAAIDLAAKEENYELVQLQSGLQQKLEAQIRKLAPDRDAGMPMGTQDTRRDWGGKRRRWWTDDDGFTWRA